MANGNIKIDAPPEAYDHWADILGNLDPNSYRGAFAGLSGDQPFRVKRPAQQVNVVEKMPPPIATMTSSPQSGIAPATLPMGGLRNYSSLLPTPQVAATPGLAAPMLGRIPTTAPASTMPMGHSHGLLGKIGSALGTAFTPNLMPEIPGTRQYREREEGRQAELDKEQAQTNLWQSEADLGPTKLEVEKARVQAEIAREEREKAAALKGQILQTDEGIYIAKPTEEGYDFQQAMGKAQPTPAIGNPLEPGYVPESTIAPQPLRSVQKPVEVSAGGSLVDPSSGKPLFTAPNKPPTGFEEETYQQELQANPNLTREQFTENREGRTADRSAQAQARAFAHQDAMQRQRELVAQAKANSITSATRTMLEAAPRVRGFVDRINTLIDQQTQQLGPAAGRWSEFMTGKVGAPNPEFTKLRTDVGLLQTLLMRMHVGARGGEYIMKHFQDLVDAGKQSPENLRAALGEIGLYADALSAERTTGIGQTENAPGEPAIGTVKQGYRYKGGGAHDKANWEKVSQ